MSDRSVVMIVDDDDSVRRAARRLIKSFGLAVATFDLQTNSWRQGG
jgi:FixJ family two-component response regulator